MEGAASSQLVRMPGSGVNAREEPPSDQQSASGAPAAQEEKTEVAKRKRDKKKSIKRSESPSNRVPRELPAPAPSGDAPGSVLGPVDGLPTQRSAVLVEVLPADVNRDALRVSDLALVGAESSSTEYLVGGRAAEFASATYARAVAHAMDSQPQAAQWPWMARQEPPAVHQLLLQDVPVRSLLDTDVAEYVDYLKMRWQGRNRGLNYPRDPVYSQVSRERITEWVTTTVRLNHYLRERVERSPGASWLAILRIRHVCLPVPSDLRAFNVPLGSLSAPEVLVVLQTALEEAGYEFFNLAPEWFSHPETRNVPVEVVRDEVQDLLAAMEPMMKVWRWVIEDATCTMSSVEQPFIHVEDIPDVEMLEVDSE